MELTEEHLKAIDAFENPNTQVIFLTGNAGTGKSTLMNYWLNQTNRNVVKLAPTGLAALNIDGQTIHSFFKIDPNFQLAHLGELKPLSNADFEGFDTIVIDEISMVRSDLMFAISTILEMNHPAPFGGKKIICVGDMAQLPPVITDLEVYNKLVDDFGGIYWHNAISKEHLKVCKLKKVFRQIDDLEFTAILNNVRDCLNLEPTIKLLNKKAVNNKVNEFAVHILTTNKLVDNENQSELNKLQTPLFEFEAKSMGNIGKDKPAPELLQIKVGAKVMFCVNNREKPFVNGEMGIVREIREKEGVILVEKANGDKIEVEKHTWATTKYVLELDEVANKKVLKPQKTAFYTQYPLKIAYAMTIHKSQGQTFDSVVLNLGYGAFAHGQTYVALSRCKSLKNLKLVKPLKKDDIIKYYDINAIL